MNRFIIKSILSLALALGAYAVGCAQTAIVVKMLDGTKNVVLLSAPESDASQVPQVTFDGDDIVIRGDHELRLAMSDVRHYVYSFDPSGVNVVKDDSPTIVYGRDRIIVTGRGDGGPVTVYSVNGAAVRRVTAPGGEAVIPIEDLPQGVYVLTTGQSSYKFLKR